MINYSSIPSNLHYYELGSVDRLMHSSEFLSLWEGYDAEVAKKIRSGKYPNDPFEYLSKLGDELDFYEFMFPKALNKTYQTWYSEGATGFCSPFQWELEHREGGDFESKYLSQLIFIARNIQDKMRKNPGSSSIYEDYRRIPKKENIRASEAMGDKENYYCLQHAIYDVSKLQHSQRLNSINYRYTDETYPITMNMYPKDMQPMIEALLQKMHGPNNIRTTSGKDFNFISFVDNIGRGEAMIFYDISDILVPIAHSIYSYETNMSILSREKTDEYTKRDVVRTIKNREFDDSVILFTDPTYSIRVIMAAIRSIENNQIDDRNENIPQLGHQLSEIIKRYPVLTEVAKDRSLFFSKLDEITVISKVIQAEYDAKNYTRLMEKHFYEVEKSNNDFAYTFRNSGNVNTGQNYSVNYFLDKSLTSEERIIMESLSQQQPIQSVPPIVKTMTSKVENLNQECYETFCSVCERFISDKANNNANFLEVISDLDKSRYLRDISSVLIIGNINHDFFEDMNSRYAEHIPFMRTILESQDLSPIKVANALIEGLEIVPENVNAMKMMQNSAIIEINKYLQANEQGEYYPYCDIVQKLMLMRMTASNPVLMKNSNKVQIDEEIPTIYKDFTPLLKMCHEKISTSLANGLDFDTCQQSIFKEIELADESHYLNNSLVSPESSQEISKFLDFAIHISGEPNPYGSENVKKRSSKIDFYLQDIITDDEKRTKVSEAWSYYGPRLLKKDSSDVYCHPDLFCKLVSIFEIARSDLTLKEQKGNDTGGIKYI